MFKIEALFEKKLPLFEDFGTHTLIQFKVIYSKYGTLFISKTKLFHFLSYSPFLTLTCIVSRPPCWLCCVFVWYSLLIQVCDSCNIYNTSINSVLYQHLSYYRLFTTVDSRCGETNLLQEWVDPWGRLLLPDKIHDTGLGRRKGKWFQFTFVLYGVCIIITYMLVFL